MKYDVFISYSSSDLGIVSKMASYLEDTVEVGLKCFYAQRDIPTGVNYPRAIVDALDNSKMMILVFTEESNKSEHVDRELELACEGKKPVIAFKMSDVRLEGAKRYYLKNLNWIEAYVDAESMFKKLYMDICRVLGINNAKIVSTSSNNIRYKNNYFKIEDDNELERLKIQMELLEDFDNDIYDKLLEGRNEIRVLDIGTNCGETIMNRLGARDNVDIIIGVDINEEAIMAANSSFKGSKGFFYKLDIESRSFITELKSIMKIHKIEKFDFINISMLLLHLENPQRIIREVQKILVDGGSIFIRDIDDGLNMAYPDYNNSFKKTIEICSRNIESGYRNSGREIPTMLANAEMCDIKLEKMGINSLGMSYEEKDALFNTYFSFILSDTRNRYEKDPNKRGNKEDHEWLESVYEKLEEDFHAHNFFFNLGFVIFTATKKSSKTSLKCR